MPMNTLNIVLITLMIVCVIFFIGCQVFLYFNAKTIKKLEALEYKSLEEESKIYKNPIAPKTQIIREGINPTNYKTIKQ